MQINVTAKTEDGEILFDGKLNRRETSFLLNYAINDLVAAGVQFNLQDEDPEPDADPALRFKFPTGTIN